MTITPSRILAVLMLAIVAVVVWRVIDVNLASQPPKSDKPAVATTVYPIYDIVQHVAGDKLTVLQIVPTGADPHEFEPVPSMAEMLTDVPVVYAIRFGYDDWITDLVSANTDIGSLATELSARTIDDGTTVTFDPHFWMSIDNMKEMAILAAKDLSGRFPEYRATFIANRDAYLAELDAADAEIHAMLDSMTEKSIVTMHDAWYYFAEAYGLSVIGTFENPNEEEKSAQEIAALADTMRAAGVTTIFADYGHNEPALTAFANDNGFTLRTVDAEGAAGTYDSYVDLMLTNAQVIAQNQ